MGSNLSGLYGTYQTTMDDKGRFALPAKLRHIQAPDGKVLLEGEIVLNVGLEGCLAIYPEAEWATIQNRLATLDFTNEDYRFFSRRFYSGVSAVTPDKNGRILVPSHIVEAADLKKDLLILGLNRWVEVWNPDRYKYYLSQYRGTFEEVAGRLFTGKHDDPGQ